MDNTVYKAIQYFRHEPSVELKYWGSGWSQIIDDSPEWEERETKRSKVELTPAQLNKQGFPTLGYTNLLRQPKVVFKPKVNTLVYQTSSD
jgi:hypothetical protein